MFPILMRYSERRKYPDVPREVPWAFVELFRERIEKNHVQTLERLAERGGLAPAELFAAAHAIKLFGSDLSQADSIRWLITALEWQN